MDVTRSDVMAAVDRLRRAADHLEQAEHVEEALEAAGWADQAATEIRAAFTT